ncbi:MAG: hypothetical protein KJZ93_10680 [Caldilineaceae bacterium]|nr:hypothetical protein [Caldilineaceae bacterium]
MLIDWFTIAAQIVNFLVLVFLLQRFLYGPIIKVMDEREQRIFARLKEAEQREAAAEEEAQQYRDERAELAERRRQLLAAAEEDAEAQRKEMLQAARDEVDTLRRQWRTAVEQEKDRFLTELRRRATHQVYTVARRALADLSDAELEQQMVRVFVRRLRDLDEAGRRALRPVASTGQRGLVVYSAFPLSERDCEEVLNTLHELTGAQPSVSFETEAGMVSGLELRSESHSVAWNLAHYLKRLEDDITHLIEHETARAYESEPEANLA